jgi:hypothetical protein
MTMESTGNQGAAQALAASGSVRSRAKMRENHKGWCFMGGKEPLYLVGWRET